LPPRKTAPNTSARELPRIQMEDLADFNESINFLVYGDSGVGKTPFAAMAPNSVMLSTEKGAISAKRFGSKSKLIKAPTWEHVEAALDFVDDLQKTAKRRDWMILDSVTKMQELLLRWILQKEVEENETRDLDIPAIQNHQKWQNMFKRFIDRIIDMDIGVIFVATSMHKEDAEGEDLVMPNIIGKDYAIAQYVCAQMDGVYCLKAVTDKKTNDPVWKLLTKTRPPYFAKDRYNAHTAVVIAPTMPEIIEAIEESAEHGAGSIQEDKTIVLEITNGDDEEDDSWDDGDEEPTSKPSRRRTPTRTPAKPARGRRAQPIATEEDEEDSDDGEEEEGTPEPPLRRQTRAQKLAAQRRELAAAKAAEEDEDSDGDGEDSQESHNRAVSRRQAKPAPKKPARKTKPARVVEEFDPDDTDDGDVSFDDDEEE